MAKKKRRAPRPVAVGPGVEGTVIRTVGSSSRVETDAGEIFDAIVRGKFRIKGINSTNPVAVGDRVKVSPPQDETDTAVITEVLPRSNYLLRKAIAHARKVHILGANLDQAILLFTVAHPATSQGFADRFLVVAEAYHIPVTIVINKIDLIQTEEEQARFEEIRDMYQKIGYKVVVVNSLDEAYRDTVIELLRDKTTFIGGHSGAGKSTLVNLIDPSLNLKTSEVSTYNQKGRHTTTFAQRYPLDGGGYIIDSPGIKEWGLVDVSKNELGHYFPEIRERMHDCKFSNCIHIKEPGCAVKAAVEANEIPLARYESYLRMLNDLEE